VTFGGVLMGSGRAVSGEHGRLFVRRSRSKVSTTGRLVLLRGGVMSTLRPLQRLAGALPSTGESVPRRWHTACQLVTPAAQLIGAGTRQLGTRSWRVILRTR
jgi:hypothetical protein